MIQEEVRDTRPLDLNYKDDVRSQDLILIEYSKVPIDQSATGQEAEHRPNDSCLICGNIEKATKN